MPKGEYSPKPPLEIFEALIAPLGPQWKKFFAEKFHFFYWIIFFVKYCNVKNNKILKVLIFRVFFNFENCGRRFLKSQLPILMSLGWYFSVFRANIAILNEITLNLGIFTYKKAFFSLFKKPGYTPPWKKFGTIPPLSTRTVGITVM